MGRYLLACAILGCLPVAFLADDKQEPVKVVTLDRKDPVLYDKDVLPVFENKCLSCHSGNVVRGRFDMTTYESVMKGGKSGQAVVPGKSASSKLVALCGRAEKPFMPPKADQALTPEELALIKLWIDQGAKAPTTIREKPKVILGEIPANIHPVRSLALSSDQSALVVGRGKQVSVYDAKSGNLVQSLADKDLKDKAHPSLVESVACSPDGKYIATGSYKEAKLWDAQTGTLLVKLEGFADRVVSLSFSPDGKMLATGGGAASEDGEIRIFDLPKGKEILAIKQGHSDTVFGVSFSPDSNKLATCGADKFVKIFDAKTGKMEKSFEGHTHHVLDVAWQADGKILASAGADNAVKLWSAERGEQIRTINGHAKEVTRVMFVPGSRTLVTCSGDGTVRFWNMQNGQQVRIFGGGPDFLHTLAISRDGKTVTTGCEDGVARVYNAADGKSIRSLPAGK